MSIACVLNTSCLAPDAALLRSSGGKGVSYDRRAWLLRNVILPTYRWSGIFSEIVVVGEFEEGDGYTYVPASSIYHNCADALWKRQMGFEALTHKVEWTLFQHDDHLYDPSNPYPHARTTAHVLAPSRWTRARGGAEPLPDGAREGYVNGHANLMRTNAVFGLFDWSAIAPVFTWDIEVTKRLAELNLPWGYAPEIKVWDIEIGAEPWR